MGFVEELHCLGLSQVFSISPATERAQRWAGIMARVVVWSSFSLGL